MSLQLLAERAVEASLENYQGLANGATSRCLVCGDRASGRHYGVLTCDGCRGFFKRSVRRNIAYACKYQGSCVVDVKRRNQCQACRFQRCAAVGMNKHAVQHERIPRKSKKLRGVTSSAAFVSHREPLTNQTNVCRSASNDETQKTLSSAERLQKPADTVEKQRKSAYSIESLLEVANKERTKYTSSPMTPPNTPPSSPPLPGPMSNVDRSQESIMFVLQTAMSWAHNMPSFVDLPHGDRNLLMQEGWVEQLLLSLAHYDCPSELLTSFFAQRLGPNLSPLQWKSVEEVNLVLGRLKALQLDATEIAYVKAIALLKPHLPGVTSRGFIETVQDGVQAMLSEYMKTKYGNSNTKFGKAILTLPLAQNINKDIFNLSFASQHQPESRFTQTIPSPNPFQSISSHFMM